jgi:hypothetical protein
MRKFFIIAAFVTVSAVIIGYGGGGGITGGTTTSAAALGEGEPCVLDKEIECECFKGVGLIEACIKSGVTLDCINPETAYAELTQKGLVLIAGKQQVLGNLLCSGESDDTAYVTLPLPKG